MKRVIGVTKNTAWKSTLFFAGAVALLCVGMRACFRPSVSIADPSALTVAGAVFDLNLAAQDSKPEVSPNTSSPQTIYLSPEAQFAAEVEAGCAQARARQSANKELKTALEIELTRFQNMAGRTTDQAVEAEIKVGLAAIKNEIDQVTARLIEDTAERDAWETLLANIQSQSGVAE